MNIARNRIEHVADYFPYGKILREFVESDEERFLTTQHERDAETGLDYRGARYYDSDIARFLSTDPWQDKYPEWSTYNYVMGNPINLIDPNGKGPTDEFKITYDSQGNRTSEKISDLGGDKFHFMHIEGGENDGKTYVKDLSTNKGTFMSTSEYILGYDHRDENTDWVDIVAEFLVGGGPEKSLIYQGSMITELRTSPQFINVKEEFYRKGAKKARIEGEFGLWGAYRAGSNMTSQMAGTVIYNFYPVGDYVIVMATDSKSRSSYSLWPFDGDEVNKKRNSNGIGPKKSTTYQTYLFYFKL